MKSLSVKALEQLGELVDNLNFRRVTPVTSTATVTAHGLCLTVYSHPTCSPEPLMVQATWSWGAIDSRSLVEQARDTFERMEAALSRAVAPAREHTFEGGETVDE